MQQSNFRRTTFALAGVSLTIALSACGGGDGDPGGTTPQAAGQQCATNGTCTPSGPTVNQPVAAICPSVLDYNTTYTGGSGAGEFVKIQLDSTKGTYRIQFLESPVPQTTADVYPTRAGVTVTGTMSHPTRPLPTEAQNNCAYELKTATASDGRSQALIDPANPPILFVGNGVAGGGIPGATIKYDGIGGFGAIPATTFAMYPVLAFAETETDFSKVAGSYNVLGYHLIPSGGDVFGTAHFAPAVANKVETINADGTCTVASGNCVTTGKAWKLRPGSDGAFESFDATGQKPYPFFFNQTFAAGNQTQAKGVLIVGKLEGKLVPLLVRVGYARIDFSDVANIILSVDDESGIALLSPTTATTASALKGGYIGSGSDFKYVASSLHDNVGAWLDPQDPSLTPIGGFQMDLTQATRPGVVNTVDNSGKTGALITTGPVYAHLFGDAANPTFRVSAVANR
ncbi:MULTISPECIES: DUF2957 domain-containing protein [unclassified Cupriavidus]|uniref:DUF2957 domain-containing protein n=1 Tax=unclassified Cupriavidus TaxID=2640874 RepID=UPI001BFFDC91|nr:MULTISPECIES: DUF2957 domain-containing protein [unclassified Cupriavidus]MCA3187641.1 DUF2957 domain-containing protein [Cupriavidus sp.]MCA3190049.1 DUF2957 domain-containing protein [Cupriavidus sp.]MCA3197500.1 DUF2957 domain-containing protein [Cupriavidus sp.]MCA3201839.1 DUF2957 domain-containing protein [Cupriavidus sp.]MCA3207860.1 DUF2957 domain-containing protein [Cupriavidus sp.]